MKLLFVHDHRFYEEKLEFYSAGSFPASIWENYTKYFEEIVVYARSSNDEKTKIVKSSSSTNNINFELTSNYSSIPTLLFNFKSLKNEIEAKISKTDITIVRLPSILGYIAAIICIKNKFPLIVEQVGSSKENYITNGSLKGKIISSFAEKLNRYIVRNAPYIHYVTKNKLQNDYPTEGLTTSISNVVLYQIIQPEEIDYSRFQSMKLKIGLIGGFEVSYKGQDVLLKAISILDNQIKKNIELYFVGVGNHDWVLKVANSLNLSENIKFIGPKQSGDEIFNFLSTLGIYIQPSFTEGMPRGMLEAMSMGCPVLGSTAGGIGDIVQEEYLHIPGDFGTISKQIESFYLNRDLLISESKRSIQVVEPYLKSNLDQERTKFYTKVIEALKRDGVKG